MNRSVKLVCTMVEDLLGAVAVVIVDVENRDAGGAVVPQALRSNRRVVQEAIAAVVVARRVVTRRPAQAERGPLPTCAMRTAPVVATFAALRAAFHVPALMGELMSKE